MYRNVTRGEYEAILGLEAWGTEAERVEARVEAYEVEVNQPEALEWRRAWAGSRPC
jgi:hypothetical protein